MPESILDLQKSSLGLAGVDIKITKCDIKEKKCQRLEEI
ncbi:hypothetical protein DesyoDRAFT_3101 [Desulfosporosinus youngiae DSM 17734]|uniref:Uncharacterized protein n=1 Tax=Desulfosporosinus youngiae DSM 17734 TaxID=768710 RepID=H5Y533_9FIRM|nr:hypothetical protein DesyoDRAFT_3101 [Desulfosporosinus youngiae DSM 17734]